MRVLFVGQVPKDINFPDDNEDAIKIVPDSGKIIVSDGASESYDSRTWARLLVSSSVEWAGLNRDWLSVAIASYKAQFDLTNLSWSKQAAFARGSFATLLLVEHSMENEINLFVVGDSLAVLLDNTELIESFPYVRAEEFLKRPELISTDAGLNSFLESPDFISKRKKTWSIKDITVPIVLCMTDALGQWALRREEEGNPVWQRLCEIKDEIEFTDLVNSERLRRNMRVDDTTLIRLSFANWGTDELSDS